MSCGAGKFRNRKPSLVGAPLFFLLLLFGYLALSSQRDEEIASADKLQLQLQRSLHKYDLYTYSASNARALLTCYTKAKPRPSKWDDAHKWLSRAPDGHGHGRRRSSGADDRLLLPSASRKGISTTSRPSWTWSSVAGDAPAAHVGGLAEGETKRVVSSVRVSSERHRCVSMSLRDVGTEMTPAGSKEPSRTNTPRAALPDAARRPHAARVPAASPSPGSRGGGAADLGAARQSPEGCDHPAAGARSTAMSPATAWGEAERAKLMARYRREELKIQAWENRERRKAELQMKMAEATAERKMVRAQEKATGKLAAAQALAKEKRARAEAKVGRRPVRVVGGAGGLPSKLKLLSLKLPLLCS